MIFSVNKNGISKLEFTIILWGSFFLSTSSGKFQLHSIRTEKWVKTGNEISDNETLSSSEISAQSVNRYEDAESETEMPVLELPVDDCGSKFASVSQLRLTPPCEGEGPGNGKPCILRRDVDYYLNGTFFSTIFSKNATLQINQVDPNFGFDTQLHPRKNVCGNYRVECPIEANEPIDFLFSGKFPASFPPLKLIVRIIVYADGDDVLLCKQLPIDVK